MNNNINLEYYKVFYVVAKYLNITNASDALFVSQPAVTQAIHKLENSLGGKLFYRQHNGVLLTEEGKNLYNFIKPSIESLDNASDRFTQYALLERGRLRIKAGGAVGDTIVYNLAAKFAKKYPKIKIEIAGGRSKENIDKLNKGDADVVFFSYPYENDKKNIEIFECANSRLVFYTTKEYLDNLGFVPTKIEDLKRTTIISPKLESNTRIVIDNFFQERGIKFEPQHEMTIYSLFTFVQNGCGIGIEYESFLKDRDDIIILDLDEKLPINKFGVATLKKEACSFATLEFIKMVKEQMK